MVKVAAAAKSRQSCPTLCDPIDGSPTGSPVPGILQARTLEWAVIYRLSPMGQAMGSLRNLTLSEPFQTPPGSQASSRGYTEKEMTAHSSVLAWRIPGTGEPGGLPSMGSHRIGHD